MTMQLVSFFLDSSHFGMDIRYIKEVNHTIQITRVPLSPPSVRGLVNIRGQVCLVLDIYVTFGRKPRPITPDSRLVIMKTIQELRMLRGFDNDARFDFFGDKPIGFIVDSIGDLITVEKGALEATPPHLDEEFAKFVDGVVRLKDSLVIVLAPNQVLAV